MSIYTSPDWTEAAAKQINQETERQKGRRPNSASQTQRETLRDRSANRPRNRQTRIHARAGNTKQQCASSIVYPFVRSFVRVCCMCSRLP